MKRSKPSKRKMPFPHNQEQFKQLIDIGNRFIYNESFGTCEELHSQDEDEGCGGCGEFENANYYSNLKGKISQLRRVFSSMVKSPRLNGENLYVKVKNCDISLPDGKNITMNEWLCFGEDNSETGFAYHMANITDVSDFYATLFANLHSVIKEPVKTESRSL